MACGCETYQCVEIPVNPCNTGTYIGIEATLTGIYSIDVLFNGMRKALSISATSGDTLSVPTFVLNENYTHEIRVTPPAGDTQCYYGHTYISSTVAGYEPTPPDNDTWQWGELLVNGDTVSSNLLSGDLSPILWINQNPTDWEEVGITHVGDELDFTPIGGVTGKIIFQYKNLTA